MPVLPHASRPAQALGGASLAQGIPLLLHSALLAVDFACMERNSSIWAQLLVVPCCCWAANEVEEVEILLERQLECPEESGKITTW